MRHARRSSGDPNSAAMTAGCRGSGTGKRAGNLSAAADEMDSRAARGDRIFRQAVGCWALLLLTFGLCGCAGFDGAATPRRHHGSAQPDWLPRPTVWRPLGCGGVDCGAAAWNGSPDATFSRDATFFPDATSPGEPTYPDNDASLGDPAYPDNATSSPAARSPGEAAAGKSTIGPTAEPESGRPFPLPASAPGSTSRLGDDRGGMREPEVLTPEPIAPPRGDPVPRWMPPAESSPAPLFDPAIPTPTTKPAVVPKIESPISVEQPPTEARPASFELETTFPEPDVLDEADSRAPAASPGVFYPEP